MERPALRWIAASTLLTVAIAAVMLVVRQEGDSDLVLRIEPIDQSQTVTVYVGGAVRSPGLYTIERGSRVAEAVEAAQPLGDADLSSLAMAALLHDGDQVIVPIRAADPQSVGTSSPTSTPPAAEKRLLDLNLATAAELETLPGIGPALAARIIEYRQTHGPFAAIEELEAIRGISLRMVDELRPFVTVGS